MRWRRRRRRSPTPKVGGATVQEKYLSRPRRTFEKKVKEGFFTIFFTVRTLTHCCSCEPQCLYCTSLAYTSSCMELFSSMSVSFTMHSSVKSSEICVKASSIDHLLVRQDAHLCTVVFAERRLVVPIAAPIPSKGKGVLILRLLSRCVRSCVKLRSLLPFKIYAALLSIRNICAFR